MAVPENDPSAAADADLRQALREALQAELAQIAPDAGLDRLHARLRADAAQAPRPAPAPHTPAGWRRALRDWFTRWPNALASVVIVLQAGLLGWQWQARTVHDEGVTWRSTGLEALGGSAQLRVAFAPQAPLQDVSALLRSLQAEAVAGPDADGVWTLAVPAAQRDAALAGLRASALVQRVAEP